MKNILVFGAGGHAKVIIDIIEKQGIYHISGIIDDNKSVQGNIVCGYQVIGSLEELPNIKKDIYGGIIAIGNNYQRAKVSSLITDILPAFKFITAIHPFTAIARCVTIGEGTVVMAGAVINTDSFVGKHCIINTRASLDHDNIIGDFATIAPNAVTGGNVKVGSFSTIALGANVIHGRTIGEHTIVGAGSTVVKDIPSYVVAYGTPARVIREGLEKR